MYPAQPERIIGEPELPFVEGNPDIYLVNRVYPYQQIEIAGQYYDKGYHIVEINIYPLFYNPMANGSVRFITSIDFTLNYENESNVPVRPDCQSELMYQTVKSQICAMVRNHSSLDLMGGGPKKLSSSQDYGNQMLSGQGNVLGIVPDYIIITNDTDVDGNAIPLYENKSMTQIFQRLADWKTQKGVLTQIVTIDEIKSKAMGVDLQEKIHNYMRGVYEKYGSIYVLFGGDVNIIPVRFDSNCATDLYYTAIENNWNANGNNIFGEYNDYADNSSEFYYGRASVENGAEASTFVDKVIVYEKMIGGVDNSYVNNVLFAAGALDESDTNIVQTDNIVNSFNVNYLNKWKLFDAVKDVSLEDELISRDSFLNNINNGFQYGKFHIVYHIDHSGYNSMGTSSKKRQESVSRADMDDLTNGNSLQILYTNGCSPGMFNRNCIVEHYLNNPNGGGVAAIASSVDSYPSERECFRRFFMEAYSPTITLNRNIGIIHDMSISSNNSFNKRKNHLFGDPEMPIWTNIPRQLTVSVTPNSISTTNSELTVNVSNATYGGDLTVCVFKKGDIYERQVVSLGSATLHVFTFNIKPEKSDSLYITVTGNNYIPYQKRIKANVIGGNLCIEEVKINDTNGNNNQKLDAGEAVNFNIKVKNNGTMSLNNVTAKLTTSNSEYITITTPVIQLANIVVGNTANGNFAFTVNKNTPDGKIVSLDIELIINGTSHRKKTFIYEVYSPELCLIQNTVIGQGDDLYSLFIDVFNSGMGDASGVEGTLTSISDVTINIPTVQYGDILNHEGKSSSVPFKFTASTYQGKILNLTLTDRYGKNWSQNVNLDNPTSVIDFDGISSMSTNNSITLRWSKISLIIGYNVYRSSTIDGAFVKINTSPISIGSFFTDMGLIPNTHYYYKLSYVNNYGSESDKTPIYIAKTALDNSLGWPIVVDHSLAGSSFMGAPNVIDSNGDGNKEIFFTTTTKSDGKRGMVWAFKHNGEELYDIDNDPTTRSGFALLDANTNSTPALGDIDGDGNIELVVKTYPTKQEASHTYMYKILTGPTIKEPLRMCKTYMWEDWNINGNVVLAPLNVSSPKLNILPVISYVAPGTHRQSILTWNAANSGFDIKYANNIVYTSSVSTGAGVMPAVGDVNNDGKEEIVIGSTRGLFTYSKQSDGSYMQNIFQYTNSEYPNMSSSAVLADIDGDGIKEIVFLMCNLTNKEAVVCVKHYDRNTFLSGWGPNETNHKVKIKHVDGSDDNYNSLTYISVGDVNKDGFPEIVVGGSATMGSSEKLHVWGKDGSYVPGFPISIREFDMSRRAPILADIDGEPDIEIICSSGNGFIYAFKSDGRLVNGFPIEAEAVTTPCVADIDNDGRSEMIAGGDGKIYVWKSLGDPGRIEWGSERFDERNSGCYKGGCWTNDEPMLVTNNQIWTDNRLMRQDIIVKNGATLTIKSIIEFAADSKIVVERGGRLIVDGGTLTNGCLGELWGGIEVWGNNKNLALPYGIVTLSNATIMNARVGITSAKRGFQAIPGENMLKAGISYDPYLMNIDLSYSGGRVYGTNSNFINNGRAVQFFNYSGNNTSYFLKCNFEVDRNDYDVSNSMINISGTKGVKIYGCSFAIADGVEILNMRGINAQNSTFTVYPKCVHGGNNGLLHPTPYCPIPSVDNYSSFKNLDYGIYATGNGGTLPYTIKFAHFKDNKRSIYSSGIDNVVITDCIIDVPEQGALIPNVGRDIGSNSLPSENILHYGIYLNASTGYQVEGNVISGVIKGNIFQNNVHKYNTYGIIINNSGGAANRVYNNTMSCLQVAAQAQGQNRDAASGVGLCFSCNLFSYNMTDIAVLANTVTLSNSIAKHQFNKNDRAAANGFTLDSYAGNVWDMYSYAGGPLVNYHAFNNTNELKYKMTEGKYTKPEIMQYVYVGDAVDHSIECPRTPISVSMFDLNDVQYELGAIKGRIKSEVDGGNTGQLVDEISGATQSNSNELNEHLLAISPYMSNESVAAAIENESAVTNVMVRDMVVVNSHAAREEGIMTKIEERSNPLPAYMYDQIDESKGYVSGLDVLETNLQNRQVEYISMLNVIANDMLDNDSITEWEALMDGCVDRDLLYGYAIYNVLKGNIDKSVEIISALEMEQDYIDFISIMANDSIVYGKISEDDIRVLMSIAENDNRVGVLASNMLSDFGYIDYEEPIYQIDDNGFKRVNDRQIRRFADAMGDNLKVYPNPAEDYVTMEYNAEGLSNDIVMTITDIDGKIVNKEKLSNSIDSINIDIKRLVSGNYILNIVSEGKIVYSKKFVVR